MTPPPGSPTIGVDVGGTKIAGGVVDADGRVLRRHQVPSEADDPDAIVAAIIEVAEGCLAAVGDAAAVGVGAAALVDHDEGIVLWAPNLAYKDLHLRELLMKQVSLPVVVDNDANVAALAEAVHGAGRGVQHQVMVTVGTGIGSGLILDGRLYRGRYGLGGELGHMIIVPGGDLCACGNHGCW
ncbi:MAG: ROK family protein, partial [Actinomycetota bacterium]